MIAQISQIKKTPIERRNAQGMSLEFIDKCVKA